MGKELNVHCMTFDSDGFGFINHRYRIEIEDIPQIPDELFISSEKHFGKPIHLKSEEHFAEKILSDDNGLVYPQSHWLWFFADQHWDVYPNLMGINTFWKLGNLRIDTWSSILDAYVNNETPALKTYFAITKHDLVRSWLNRVAKKLTWIKTIYLGII